MKKRYHDIEIWKKRWFMNLSPQEKCAVFYIKDDCDNVGVWDANIELAEFIIKADIDWKALLDKANGNIQVLDNGKWWIVDFCMFQYTELSENSTSPPIKSHVNLLKKHGLWEEYLRVAKGYGYPRERVTETSVTLKEKEKEKVKVKEKDKVKEEDKEKDLYNVIKNRFESKQLQQRFTNYPKEGKAIHGLISKARIRAPDDPETFLEGMIRMFEYLRSTDKFYKSHPFLPSSLNSSGIWDRVMNAAEQRWKEEQAAQVVNVSDVPL